MKIKPGDDIHSAIKKICEDSTRAGSLVVLLQREFPDTTLDYLKMIDSRGLYGHALADFFFKDCSSDVNELLKRINN